MSELVDLLDTMRSPYIRKFEEVRAKLAVAGGKVFLEPALLNAKGEVVREGALNIGVRVDAVVLAENGSYERVSIDSDRMTTLEPVAFDHGGLTISISPFQWDYVRLWTDGDIGRVSQALARWFDQAFQNDAQGAEEGGVVHFMSDPEHEDGRICCILDLGTAPASALINLFDHLRDVAATRVELGPTHN